MKNLASMTLALIVLCIRAQSSLASKCDGVGVAETLATMQTECCPARKHGAFVSCAAHVTRSAIKAHVLSAACKHRILRTRCEVPTTTTAPSTITTTSSTVTTTSTSLVTTTSSSPTTTTTSTLITTTSTTTTTTVDGSQKPTTTTSTTTQPSTTSTSSTTSTTQQSSSTTSTTTTTLPAPITAGTTTTTTVPGPQEICGNCIDDDGDGLVDFEDPKCCAQSLRLDAKRMVLKPLGLHVHGNRLKVKARYTLPASALFDPTAQDTTIQISDAKGELFCQTVAAEHWKHPHHRLYGFQDKQGLFAGGLKKGRFKVKHNSIVIFGTRGKKVDLRPTDGDHIVVTVRVGNQCARETMNLRSTKTALVFP